MHAAHGHAQADALPTEALIEFTFPRGYAQVRRLARLSPADAGAHPALGAHDGAYHRTLFGAHALRRGPRSHTFLLLGAEDEPAAARFCLVLEALQPVCAGLALPKPCGQT